jgi:hypothetical protein
MTPAGRTGVGVKNTGNRRSGLRLQVITNLAKEQNFF